MKKIYKTSIVSIAVLATLSSFAIPAMAVTNNYKNTTFNIDYTADGSDTSVTPRKKVDNTASYVKLNINYSFVKDTEFYRDNFGNIVFYRRLPVMGNSDSYISEKTMLTADTNELRNKIYNQVIEIKDSDNIIKSTGGDHGEYAWDSSGSVKIRSRIYYTTAKNSKDKFTYAKISKVTGGYSPDNGHIGSGVRVKKQKLKIVQKGKRWSDFKYTDSQEDKYEPAASANSWKKSAPGSWQAVCTETPLTSVGCTYKVYLLRGTSNKSWSVELKNTPIETTP